VHPETCPDGRLLDGYAYTVAKYSLTRFGGRLEAFLFLLLCLSLIWIPLPGASNRYWSMMGWSALVFAIAALWFFAFGLGVVHLSSKIKKNWLPILCLLLIQLWTLIQWHSMTGWTLDRTASFYILVLGFAYTFLFALLLQFLNSKRSKRLLIIIFGSAVAQALYGVMMVLTELEIGFLVEKIYFKGQATGTFINPNHFAAYIVMGLSIGIAVLMVKMKDLKGKENLLGRSLQVMMSGSLAWRLALIVLVVGLVMSSSRMGNVSFVFALFAASGLYMLIKRRLMWVWIFLLASILIIDTVVIGTKFGVDRLVSEMAGTAVREETRASVLQASLPMINDFLWLGSGAGSYYSVFPMYRVDSVGVDFYKHVHNDYVEFLIELGVIGVLPLIVFVFLSLRASYRALIRRDNWAQIAGYAALMSMIAIAVHSTADFSLRIPAYATTLIAVLAVTYSEAQVSNGSKRRKRRKQKVSKELIGEAEIA